MPNDAFLLPAEAPMKTAAIVTLAALAIFVTAFADLSPAAARGGRWDCDSSGCRWIPYHPRVKRYPPGAVDCDSSGCSYPNRFRAYRGPDGRLYDCDSSGCRPLGPPSRYYDYPDCDSSGCRYRY
jgi:hypothetical protein